MSKTILLIGAGFNQGISDFKGLNPPLSNNFFSVVLNQIKNENIREKIVPILEIIEEIWHLTSKDLLNYPFNLEELYTYLKLKSISIESSEKKYKDLLENLTRILSWSLKKFEPHIYRSLVHLDFGKKIYKRKPNILTFNYDCILESIIESASMPRSESPKSFGHEFNNNKTLPKETLLYSHFNWNRPKHYGIKFGKLNLYQAGPKKYVNGNDYYSLKENELSNWMILKLHGSLNWFQLTEKLNHSVDIKNSINFYNENREKIFLLEKDWWLLEPPTFHNFILQPLLITPTLYKHKDLNFYPFNKIWEFASKELSQCDKLISIGYSFPPTDFPTKMLFLDSFSNNYLDELIIVNPDKNIGEKIMNYTNFDKKPVQCGDLNEFNAIY